MDKGVFHRIHDIERSLEKCGVDPEIMAKILDGGDKVLQKYKTKVKAQWLKEAMDRMDALLPDDVKFKSREECACCTTGTRLKLIKQIAKENPDIDDFFRAVDKSHVFGEKVEKTGDVVHVNFGLGKCVCTPGALSETTSITYCHCCKGHVLKLLEAGLGRKLRGDVVGSACSGTAPCRFTIYLS